MKRLLIVVTLILCAGLILSFADARNPQNPAEAGQPTGTATVDSKANNAGGNNMEDVGKVLLVFLVLSVVFEVALTPIFDWRVFMVHFEGKGYKTPITVALAFIVFWSYGLDIIRDLLVALGKKAEISIGGQILTALLIAGGSSGIFQIFTKLKIRTEPQERKRKTEEARKDLEARKAKASGTN